MTVATDNLLVKFREKDSPFGVTRRTVRAMAKELDVPETQVIHFALSKLAQDVLPAYEADDGPLKAKQITALRRRAATNMPKGKVISKDSLFK
jgi:hypothetical protein